MAQDMEKVMEMTLDEYIASFKAEKKSNGNSVHKNCTKNESKFKAERRLNDEEGEYDEFKEDIDAESSGIWRGPSASISYIDLDMPEDDTFEKMVKDEADGSIRTPQRQKQNQQQKQSPRTPNQQNFDLRDKISGNPSSSMELMPNSNSQQWRLMQPNVMSQRPAGMPPLVPQNTFEDRRSNQLYKRNRFQKNRSNRRNGFNNNRNNNANVNGSTNSNNNAFNNGRIQRFNQRNYNQEILNKNIKAIFDQLNEANGHLLPQKVHDLTIECPSDSINLTSNPCPSSTLAFNPASAANVKMTYQVPTHASSGQSTNSSSNKSNDSLRALLGINDTSSLKNEMMPMLASKFLDFFQNVSQQTTHKPIYDMKVQKEIHELQKKPLLYKCPGGEVVSSDGTGINCEIIPRTSGMSLNHRFA